MGMMRSALREWRLCAGAVLVAIGLGLLALPTEWIEGRSGSAPGDDGLFELLLGLVPLVLGVALLASLTMRRHGVVRRSGLHRRAR